MYKNLEWKKKIKVFHKEHCSQHTTQTLSQTPSSSADNFVNSDGSSPDSGTFFTSLAGVYQGLSPFLFSMFIIDIEEELKSRNRVGIIFENLVISLILFADDMAILSKTKQGLQEGLNRLEK